MKLIGIALAIYLCVSFASAAEPTSAYAGQETREIKALAPAEIEGLLAGKGLGYAKSAELNRYPGPAHVLELAPQLQLTEEQIKATRDIHARMEEQAKRLGAHLVEAEIALERLFQAETANEMSVRPALELIGQLQAELRGVHLLAHIQQKRVLSQEQTARYVRLRGYHGGHHGASGHTH